MIQVLVRGLGLAVVGLGCHPVSGVACVQSCVAWVMKFSGVGGAWLS